jgi:hypothetical protein
MSPPNYQKIVNILPPPNDKNTCDQKNNTNKKRITKIKNPEKPREWPKWPCGGSVIPRYG